MERIEWLICYGGSDMDGVNVELFVGTADDVKAKLVEDVETWIEEEEWEKAEYYTDSVDSVEARVYVNGPDGYYAYVSFENYHVDIEAIPVQNVMPERR